MNIIRKEYSRIYSNIRIFATLWLSPDVSYMWADHHQLQVTANLYNTPVQVLKIDEHGNGSLVSFKPDPRMAQFSLLPATKPNGEKIEVEEVWLIYTNGNHYDALISEDGQIMTLGTLDIIEMEDQDLKDFLEIDEYDKAEKTDNSKKRISVMKLKQIHIQRRS